MKEIRWERLAAMAICIAAFGVLLLVGLRWLLPVALPFLLGWAIAACLRPLAAKLSAFLHLPRGLCAAVLLFLTLSGIILLTGAALRRLFYELQGLLSRLLESGAFATGASSFDVLGFLTDRMGISALIDRAENYPLLRDRVNAMLYEALKGLVTAMSAELPHAAARILSAMPSVLLFTAITVIAGFYFCVDSANLTRTLNALLPVSIRSRLPAWRAHVRRFSWKYARAYLLLLLCIFSALLLGLLLLGVEYAFLIALLTAAVDLLPVLGVGAVLVPWAAIELIQRNFPLGIGLLVLYLAVSVLRQILEPRLVGKSIGLHPLLTLAAGYAGFRSFGFLGMLLGPILLALLKTLFRGGREQSEKTAPSPHSHGSG